MASPTISSVKHLYIGPTRRLSMIWTDAGTEDTQELTGPYSSSTTLTRAFAVLQAPLAAGAADSNLRLTAVSGGRPTFTIDDGAAGDQRLVQIVTW